MNKAHPNTLIATAVVMGILSLTGCGEGTNQATAPGVMAPPANTKTTIVIGNTSDVTYARAVLLDQNGNTLTDQEINCRAGQTDCTIFLSTQVKQPSTLLVLDSNRRMIRAFQFPGELLSYNSAYPTSLTTGLYLTKRLASKYLAGTNLDNVNTRLAIFFENYKSPDGSADYFAELGDYYEKQTADSGITEDEFLDKLKNRLEGWEVAKPVELPGKKKAAFSVGAIQLKRAANSSKIEGCGEGVDTFLTIGDFLGGTFPLVGGVISSAFGIAKDACNTTGAKIDEISSQLESLKDSVNNLGGEVGKIKSLNEMTLINSETDKFKSLQDKAKLFVSDYKTFLANKGVTSLEAYFDKEGSWKQGLDNGQKLLQENILGEMRPLIQETSKFESNIFNSYLQALESKCGDLSWAQSQNFIAVRQFCNTNILANTASFVGVESMLLPIFTDIFSTLSKYEKEDVVLKYPYPVADVKSYKDVTQKVSTMFKSQQAKLVQRFKDNIPADKAAGDSGLYAAYAGINVSLINSLKAGGWCHQSGSRADYPSITGWYAPTLRSADAYITTQCRIPGTSNLVVNAKYYYNNQGSENANDVTVVLGVPVATGYTIGDRWMPKTEKEQVYANSRKAIFEAPTVKFFSNWQEARGKVINFADEPGFNVLHAFSDQPGKYWAESPPDNRYVGRTTWILVSGANPTDFADVAKLRLQEEPWGSRVKWQHELICATPTCRVEHGQWLRFENGQTLDVWGLKRKTSDNLPLNAIGPKGSIQ